MTPFISLGIDELPKRGSGITMNDMVCRGFPVSSLGLCTGTASHGDENELRRRVREETKAAAAAWPAHAYCGADAALFAGKFGYAVMLGQSEREIHQSNAGRIVAGPPATAVLISRVRGIAADLLEQVYHPLSPLLGLRPVADDPSGLDVPVGTLVVFAAGLVSNFGRQWPKVVQCVRRRVLEGLPTAVAFSGAPEKGQAEMLRAMVPGLTMLAADAGVFVPATNE